MSKEKVMSYVFNTLHNTNPAILRQLLDESDESCNVFIFDAVGSQSIDPGTIVSYQEVADAIDEGKAVFCYLNGTMMLTLESYDSEGVMFSKNYVDMDNNVMTVYKFGIPANATNVDYLENSYDLTTI